MASMAPRVQLQKAQSIWQGVQENVWAAQHLRKSRPAWLQGHFDQMGATLLGSTLDRCLEAKADTTSGDDGNITGSMHQHASSMQRVNSKTFAAELSFLWAYAADVWHA